MIVKKSKMSRALTDLTKNYFAINYVVTANFFVYYVFSDSK